MGAKGNEPLEEKKAKIMFRVLSAMGKEGKGHKRNELLKRESTWKEVRGVGGKKGGGGYIKTGAADKKRA